MILIQQIFNENHAYLWAKIRAVFIKAKIEKRDLIVGLFKAK
jgi:hypothetical protein